MASDDFGNPGPAGFGVPPGGGEPPQGFGTPPVGRDLKAWSPVDGFVWAWELLKEKPAEVILPFALSVLVVVAGSFVMSFAGGSIVAIVGAVDEDLASLAALVRIPFQLGQWAIQAYATAGMTVFALKLVRQEEVSLGDVFSGGPYTLRVFLSFLLVGLLAILGGLFCLVPGVILSLGLCMTTPLIVDKDMGPVEAMKASWALTRGHKISLLVFGLTACGLGLVGALACCVGGLVTNPIVSVAFAWTYVHLSESGTGTMPR